MLTMSSGSLTAISGVMRGSTIAILICRFVSVIIVKLVISLAVPAVVFTVISGGILL